MKTLLFLLLAVLFSSPVLFAKKPPPNIVFFFTDDHAPHAIGAYGGWLKDVAPTPNIDKLAAEGMLFERSYCANSICGPSRANIITGKHSHANGFRNNGDKFDGGQQTFPKLLQSVGYQTAVIGKWHLKSDPQGFDFWRILPGQGDYYNPILYDKDGRKRYQGYCTDVVTDMGIKWLKQDRDADKPFLLMCQHKAPHRTWMPALRHLTMFDGMDLPEAPTLFDQYEDNASGARYQEMEIDRHMSLQSDLKVPEGPGLDFTRALLTDKSTLRNWKTMTPEQQQVWTAAYKPKNDAAKAAKLTGRDLVRWKYQRYVKDYLRCIAGVDENIGRVMQAVRDAGLEENTVFVYSSDQGFYLGDHGWYDKRWMYEESFMMPLIIKWPGVTKPGSRNKDLVQNIDYAPTFLEMAGATIPDDIHGTSLVPLLRGETPENWRDRLYYHYYEYPSVHMVPKHIGIAKQRWKLMHFYEFGEYEMYDLQADPDELDNLAEKPEHAEMLAALKQELLELKAHFKDPMDLTPKPKAWQTKVRDRRMVEKVK